MAKLMAQVSQLLLELDEIKALEQDVGMAIERHTHNLTSAQSTALIHVINGTLAILNSLRIALAEARVTLERVEGL